MSIADEIYQSLKSQLFEGKIKPGDRLVEIELAKKLQVSRTPVREAFRRLEQDSLVERTAQGGVMAPEIDMDSIQDLYDLRTVIEVYAIELVCDRISPEDLSKLRQTKVQAFELLDSEGVNKEYTLNRFVDLNSNFHDIIYQATGSKYLIRTVNNLREIVRSLRSLSIQATNACNQAWQEHSLLIEYLSQKNKEAASSLIKTHIKNAYNQYRSMRLSEPAKGMHDKGKE